jgi:hypothetical protein
MEIDTKILNKYLQTDYNSTFKISYTMIKLVSFQRCKDDPKYKKQ